MQIAINNLKEICRCCSAAQPLDPELTRWLGESLRKFLDQEQPTVDEALGLKRPQGGIPWWREEAMWKRDTALRALAELSCGGMSVTRRARTVRALSIRYAASAWRFDRARETMPAGYAGSEKEFLWRAFKSGAPMPLGERQLRTVLAS